MAEPYYRINDVNILPYLADHGFSWEENDIDAENSGRTMDGVMHRKLVVAKDKHGLSFRPMTALEAQTVLGVFSGQNYVTVQTNVHPKRPGDVTLTMYNSSRKAGVYTLDDDGNAVWVLDSISLIER